MSNKRTKSGLVPKLRFPEFRDAGKWEERSLKKVFSIFQGFAFSSHDSVTEGLRWLKIADVGIQQMNHGAPSYLPIEYKEKYEIFLVKRGDYVIALTRPILSRQLKMAAVDEVFDGALLNQRVGKLVTTQNISFVYFLLQTSKVINDLEKSISGSEPPNLSVQQIEDIKTYIPSEKEQQKIADCLSSVDDLITAQSKKLDTLKAHKKELMQQLFPAEGETLPKLRFPEFRDAGEWDERELGPLTTKVGSGITPTGGDKNYKTKGRPFVRSQNVGWGELILNDVAFIDEETHQSFDSTEIKVSDVLLNITGASIGRSAVADSRIAGGNVNQHVCIIRAQPVELNPALLNYFLISERGQKQIDSFQAGGNRQGLNFAQIRSFVIPLPSTEHEQRRIADCLSSIDDLITAQTQKLDMLKAHKKGLMQQLFPTLDEAQG